MREIRVALLQADVSLPAPLPRAPKSTLQARKPPLGSRADDALTFMCSARPRLASRLRPHQGWILGWWQVEGQNRGLSGPDPPTPTITWSISFAHSRSPREQVCRAGHLGHLAARLALRAVLGCFGPRIRCAARRTSGGDSFGLSSNEVVESKSNARN